MAIHHHTKTQPNNYVFRTLIFDLWPVTLTFLVNTLWTKNISLMVMHHHTKFLLNCSYHFWDTYQKCLPDYDFDLWPLTWTFWVITHWTKNEAIMAIHHHTKTHWNWFSHLRDTGQTCFSDFDFWPVTRDLDLLGEHFMNIKYSTHGYAPPHQTSFELVLPFLRYRPKMSYRLWFWPLTRDLDLLGNHLLNTKWCNHGYTPPYQNSLKLVQPFTRYWPNTFFGLLIFDLWPWPFGWTLHEQKISYSWLYTIIPNFIQIGQTDSWDTGHKWLQDCDFDLWPTTWTCGTQL